MREEHKRRYARHIMLPDVGEAGQVALMAGAATLETAEPAALIAGSYLAAGGVGTVVASGASDAQRAELSAHGSDTQVTSDGDGRTVALASPPAWWPAAEGDATSLAFWRGGVAATAWMAELIDR